MSAKLHVLDAEPQGEGIVKMLEEALERAYAGEISSAAIVNRDGTTQQMWSFLPSFGLMIGSAMRLVHKLNLEMDE